MRACCAILNNMALADTGARTDPFVIGVYHLLQIRVGQNLGRNVACDASYFGRNLMGHGAPWDSVRCAGDKKFYAMALDSDKERSGVGRQDLISPRQGGALLQGC